MQWLVPALLAIGAAVLAKSHNSDSAKRRETDAKETEKKIREDERNKAQATWQAEQDAAKRKSERAELKRLREEQRLSYLAAQRGK